MLQTISILSLIVSASAARGAYSESSFRGAGEPFPTPPAHYTITNIVAAGIFCWYLFVISIALLGVFVVKTRNTRCDNTLVKSQPPQQLPGVTILRPLKGIETEMEACLSSAFLQKYANFEIIFCIEEADDPAVPVCQAMINQFPTVDAKLMIGEDHYGPNPKINNLVKGYKAAKNDILWVLDSNAWVSPGTLARSVAQFQANPKIKLVHHLPLAVSIRVGWDGNIGSRLDEMFLFTAHSKFYSAINTVAVAPCVMGKSNLYRRSDLDQTVNSYDSSEQNSEHFGLQTFAAYIAEDNMIAEAIWSNGGRTAMTSDSVIQPLSNVSFKAYQDRRVRWLRVRRYMVLLATLIEPTTESVLCSAMAAWSISILFSATGSYFNWIFFIFHLSAWCLVDYWHFHNLLAFDNVEHDDNAPYFIRRFYNADETNSQVPTFRPFFASWLPVWLAREFLALPIWIQAMSGHQIYWRNRPFKIKPDLTAEEIRYVPSAL